MNWIWNSHLSGSLRFSNATWFTARTPFSPGTESAIYFSVWKIRLILWCMWTMNCKFLQRFARLYSEFNFRFMGIFHAYIHVYWCNICISYYNDLYMDLKGNALKHTHLKISTQREHCMGMNLRQYAKTIITLGGQMGFSTLSLVNSVR